MSPADRLIAQNIEALTQDEEGGGMSWKDCGAVNYSPDAEIRATTHTTTVTSDGNGNIEINGITKGGYGKNKSYSVTYEILNCETRPGACCDQGRVGVRVVSVG